MTSAKKPIDINTLRQLFQKSADVHFQSYTFNQHTVHFITCDAMIDQQLLNEVIVQRVQELLSNNIDQTLDEAVKTELILPDLLKVEDKEDAISLVFSGHLLLFLRTSFFYIQVILLKNLIEILKKPEWKWLSKAQEITSLKIFQLILP